MNVNLKTAPPEKIIPRPEDIKEPESFWEEQWHRLQAFFKEIWQDCKNPLTLTILILVALVLYSPVWGGLILSYLFHWKWAAAMAGAVALFWAGPAPFFPVCLAITLFIKHVFLPESTLQKKHPQLALHRPVVHRGVSAKPVLRRTSKVRVRT